MLKRVCDLNKKLFFIISLLSSQWVYSQGNLWKQASAGVNCSAGIKADGTLWVWGANKYGQLADSATTAKFIPIQVGNESNWEKVSVGSTFTLALKKNGTLWIWGRDSRNGWPDTGSGADLRMISPIQVEESKDWKDINAGLCLKKDGTLWQINSSSFETRTDSKSSNKITPHQVGKDNDWEVIAFRGVALAIKTDGSLWGWGENYNKQLGDSTLRIVSKPTRIGKDNDWKTISIGSQHTMGLKKDGTLWAWGWTTNGELGIGRRIAAFVPARVGIDKDWSEVSSGVNFTVALKNDGTCWAWGENSRGQLGDGTNFTKYAPVRITNKWKWKKISARGAHVLAIKSDNSLWAWGGNIYGEMGIGNNFYSKTPVLVSSSESTLTQPIINEAVGLNAKSLRISWQKIPKASEYALDVSLNPDFTKLTGLYKKKQSNELSIVVTGLLPNQTYYYRLRATTGTLTSTYSATGSIFMPQDKTADCWVKCSAGYGYILCIKSDGSLWARGENYTGQLGDGTQRSTYWFVRIGKDTDWKEVFAGSEKSFAIKNNGTLWAWGKNENGELGDGTKNKCLIPKQVGESNGWKYVAYGRRHIVGLKTDGTLWAWGNNDERQLGDGTRIETTIPKRIGIDTDWQVISAFDNHNLAIKTNGTLWGWGRAYFGETVLMGIQWIPTQIGKDNDWQDISTQQHVIALKKNGTIWGWGSNSKFQLGDGTNKAVSSPKQIGKDKDWKKIRLGGVVSLGIKNNGTLWGWGDNNIGQRGDGKSEQIQIPEQIGTENGWKDLSLNGTSSLLKSDGTLWVWGNNFSLNFFREYDFAMTPIQIDCETDNPHLSAPVSYQPESITPTSFIISWSKVAGARNYDYLVCPEEKRNLLITGLTNDTTALINTYLSPDTRYCIVVSAKTPFQRSANSEEIIIKTEKFRFKTDLKLNTVIAKQNQQIDINCNVKNETDTEYNGNFILSCFDKNNELIKDVYVSNDGKWSSLLPNENLSFKYTITPMSLEKGRYFVKLRYSYLAPRGGYIYVILESKELSVE